MSDSKDLLKKALYEGEAFKTAPVACTDPECGYVYQYLLDPETESWDDVPEYVECGRFDRPDPENEFNLIEDDCPGAAKVFKDETVPSQNDKTPSEIANEIHQEQQSTFAPATPREPDADE